MGRPGRYPAEVQEWSCRENGDLGTGASGGNAQSRPKWRTETSSLKGLSS
jgi:hypothetical protein